MDSQSAGATPIPRKLITILVALYEAGSFIQAKLQNLRQLCNFDDCWIVLLNCENKHNEADAYADFVAQYSNVIAIRYVDHVNLYTTWNHGIITTNSTYVMNSNVDDMLHTEYVRTCTQYLDANRKIAAVSSKILVTDVPNQVGPDWEYQHAMPFLAYPLATAGPCPVWRKSLHYKYGLFDPRCEVVGDAIMWEKWVIGGETFGLIDQPLALYYRNPGSLERRRDNYGVSLIDKDLQRLGRTDG